MTTILHFIPTLEGGGAERQLSMLAIEQQRRGHRVHVGINRGGIHEQMVRDGGVTVHILTHPIPGKLGVFLSIFLLARRIKPNIIQTWLMQMDILGGAAALLNRTPWILSERSCAEHYKDPSWSERVRILLAKHCDAISANSRGGVKYWEDHIKGPKVLRQIPNAINLDAIDIAARITTDHVPQASNFLVVGRLIPSKGLDVVIRAASLIPAQYEFHISLIGDGAIRDELQSTIKYLQSGHRISIRPFQSDWWRLLPNASALISTSRYEGQPNVILEAMAARCPVIVTDIEAHREILSDASALIVPVDDPKALAKALILHLDGLDMAKDRATCARAAVTPLSVGNAADSYDQLYGILTSGPTTPSTPSRRDRSTTPKDLR